MATVYTTQKNQIRGLPAEAFEALLGMCRTAKNLYNVGLFNLRQEFFATGQPLTYEANCKIAKTNDNYRLLQAGVSQQILGAASAAFASFLGLKRLVERGEYPAEKVHLPRYLDKDGYFNLILSTNAITIRDGVLVLPWSREFKRQHPGRKPITIPFPSRLDPRTIKEIRILPKYDARFFEIEFVCQTTVQPAEVEPDQMLAIDLGLDNLAACLGTTGASFLIDGKSLKSINQWYNQQNARLQSIKDKQGIESITAQQARLNQNRNHQVRDTLNKAARHIINHCLEHRIRTVIVDCNPGWKQEINLGHVTNQNFVQIPHWQLRRKLKGHCERYGLEYLETEEAYSSKSSFLDLDPLPSFQPGVRHTFSGKRIKRGLYRSKDGRTVNADLHGAANIMRKSNRKFDFERLASGLLASPLRIRLA
ncbi:MAG: transposase [Blastocatellia bacterium]|nr:transposase [Blastocatellia bacterium]